MSDLRIQLSDNCFNLILVKKGEIYRVDFPFARADMEDLFKVIFVSLAKWEVLNKDIKIDFKKIPKEELDLLGNHPTNYQTNNYPAKMRK